ERARTTSRLHHSLLRQDSGGVAHRGPRHAIALCQRRLRRQPIAWTIPARFDVRAQGTGELAVERQRRSGIQRLDRRRGHGDREHAGSGPTCQVVYTTCFAGDGSGLSRIESNSSARQPAALGSSSANAAWPVTALAKADKYRSGTALESAEASMKPSDCPCTRSHECFGICQACAIAGEGVRATPLVLGYARFVDRSSADAILPR